MSYGSTQRQLVIQRGRGDVRRPPEPGWASGSVEHDAGRLALEIRSASRWRCRIPAVRIELKRGGGAGSIGGWTLFLAVRTPSPGDAQASRRARLLRVGWTRNANRTPFLPGPT